MKHLQTFESLEEKEKYRLSAKILADKLGKKFFKNVGAFDKIRVPYNENQKIFIFKISFLSIKPISIQKLIEFNEYMGFDDSDWLIQVDGPFDYDTVPTAYEEFHIFGNDLGKYLEKLEMDKEAKKYNL